MRRLPHFLIRGFDPLIDAIECGRELIPLTRKIISTWQLARGGRGMIRLMLAGALLFLGIGGRTSASHPAGWRPEG